MVSNNLGSSVKNDNIGFNLIRNKIIIDFYLHDLRYKTGHFWYASKPGQIYYFDIFGFFQLTLLTHKYPILLIW